MTPELEKVARAICIENLKSTKQPHNDGTVEHYWRHFIMEARAALEAIREPSEGMVKAHDDEPFSNGFSERAHKAMIDHILGKEPTP